MNKLIFFILKHLDPVINKKWSDIHEVKLMGMKDGKYGVLKIIKYK